MPTLAADKNKSHEEDPADSYRTYFEYNKVLRTWFVAFGVGGPALFLVNEKVAEQLVKFGLLKQVATLFLAGAAAQIVGALLNKITNWYSYIAGYEPGFKKTRRYRFADWYTHAFWVDIWIDVFTIVCFGIASWRMFTIFSR